jgi:hypothetical protein
MPTELTIVTREELFELLWKSLLLDVARQIHLAPASLRRACRQLRVPVPGITHWRKKWEGREGERPALTPVPDGEPTELLLRRRGAADPSRATSRTVSQAATASPRPRVHVSSSRRKRAEGSCEKNSFEAVQPLQFRSRPTGSNAMGQD